MSYPDVFPSGPVTAPARPERCTCTSPVAATLAETLACPLAWHEQADGTWKHTRRVNAGAGLRARPEAGQTARAWISGECADGQCWMCPGEPLTDDLPPCAHPCHDDQKD